MMKAITYRVFALFFIVHRFAPKAFFIFAHAF